MLSATSPVLELLLATSLILELLLSTILVLELLSATILILATLLISKHFETIDLLLQVKLVRRAISDLLLIQCFLVSETTALQFCGGLC